MTGAGPTNGLAIRDLCVTYGSGLALDHVTLSCSRGEMVGLLGPNGAGKSTLLKAMLGLVPPLQGEVTLDGVPLDRSLRHRVAYMPQRGEVDWSFPLTVEEVVLLGRQGRLGLLGRPKAADRTAALDALDRLGMVSHRRALIGELSGGQQQRVFLSRALAQHGDALLLDEPLTGVDTETQEVVLRLLAELRRDGQAILITTHDLPQAAAICDRLCVLNHRVVALGTPDEVFAAEVLAAAQHEPGLLGGHESPHIQPGHGATPPPRHAWQTGGEPFRKVDGEG